MRYAYRLIHLIPTRRGCHNPQSFLTTLSLSNEVREHGRERQAQRVAMVRGTQELLVADRLEEVHHIRNDSQPLAMRFDGFEERFERLKRRMDRGLNQIKAWSEGLAERLWTKEQTTDENDRTAAATLQTILERLDDVSGLIRLAE